jgi:beta,beta-carotene 9',10'-dioxygenase
MPKSQAGARAESTATEGTARDHRLGFASLDRQLPATPLEVEGRLPAWLAGSLLRTGPAQFEVGSRGYRHWFDGLAMLHRFGFAGGAVTYANRFLDSPAYRAARDTGQITYSEFATDPCRTLFRRVATTFAPPRYGANANVSIDRRGEEFVALTESPLPVVFDPGTLATLGVAPRAPGQMTVAHPHRVPGTGELVSYATRFGPFTRYRIYTQDERSHRPRVIAQLPAPRPSYMHSFAITERHVVLAEYPFTVVPVAIPLSGRPLIANYRWQPRRGTRFRIVDLDNPSATVTCQAEPFFAFHHVNAFQRGGEIVVDLCGYDDAGVIGALYLDRLRAPDLQLPAAQLRRYRLPLDGGDAIREPLPEIRLELPRIDYGRRNGRPYRYAYGVGTAAGADAVGGFPDRITRADVDGGAVTEWAEPGAYPGEPVFVPTPGGEREDDGVLLSVVLDPAAGTSFLLVLDAASLGEIARARVPHHIPFGFHGSYYPDPAGPGPVATP